MKPSMTAAFPQKAKRPDEPAADQGKNLSQSSLNKIADIVALSIHEENAFLRQELDRHARVLHDLTKRVRLVEAASARDAWVERSATSGTEGVQE